MSNALVGHLLFLTLSQAKKSSPAVSIAAVRTTAAPVSLKGEGGPVVTIIVLVMYQESYGKTS